MPADITLDGFGYNILPKGYRKFTDNPEANRPGTWQQRDFVGGTLRAIQLETDRGWYGQSIGPAAGGQGVEPWPYRDSYTDTAMNALGTVATTVRCPSIVLDPYAYVAIGRYLYQSVSMSAGSWANWTKVADVGAGVTITAITPIDGKVIIATNTSLDLQQYNPSGGALSSYLASSKAWRVIGYAGTAIWSDASTRDTLKMLITGTTVDTRRLDAPIVNMCPHDGKIAIATRQSVYLLSGKPDTVSSKWIGEPEPLFSNGQWTDDEDFTILISYAGRLYTWLGNRLMQYEPNGDRRGWKDIGLEGRSCHGACVAGGWLIVSIVSRSGVSETWGWDGSAWWPILQSTSQTRVWPTYTAGAGNIDVVLFRDGSTSVTYDICRLVYRHDSAQSYPKNGSTYQTSMIDAGHREAPKAWRSISATFGLPEQRGVITSINPVTVNLAYSVDGGLTWSAGATSVYYAGSGPLGSISTAFHGISMPEGFFLMLRVTWSQPTDWAPILTGLSAEYDILETIARRRRWKLSLRATDHSVNPDGSVDARSGQQAAADLWSSWENGSVVSFTDVDGTAYTVQIIHLSETMTTPANAKAAYESQLDLQLVEM